jgi:hypothetical protein
MTSRPAIVDGKSSRIGDEGAARRRETCGPFVHPANHNVWSAKARLERLVSPERTTVSILLNWRGRQVGVWKIACYHHVSLII